MEPLGSSWKKEMEGSYQVLTKKHGRKDFLTPIERSNESLVTRPLGMKWVFKIKDDGIYCSLLVSKVYLHKEYIYYNLNHSPLLFDVSLIILLIYYLQNPIFKIVNVDIKKDFPEAKVEENISIKKPTILKEMDDNFKNSKFRKLNKSVYGLVQDSKTSI